MTCDAPTIQAGWFIAAYLLGLISGAAIIIAVAKAATKD